MSTPARDSGGVHDDDVTDDAFAQEHKKRSKNCSTDVANSNITTFETVRTHQRNQSEDPKGGEFLKSVDQDTWEVSPAQCSPPGKHKPNPDSSVCGDLEEMRRRLSRTGDFQKFCLH